MILTRWLHHWPTPWIAGLFLVVPVFGDPDLPFLEGLLKPERFIKHVKVLASEDLEGRGTGTHGQKAAGIYIAAQFKKCGLEPVGNDGTYFQRFSIVTPKPSRSGPQSHLEILTAGEVRKITTQDYQPFGFSRREFAKGPLVFVGYSITSHDLHYDDFSGIDMNGKIALCMRHSPGEARPESPFGPVQMKVATFVNKARCAAEAGARALILVNDPSHKEDFLIALAVRGRRAAIPIIQMKRSIAEEILQSAGKDLSELQREIDESLRPNSFEIPDSEVTLHVDIVEGGKKKVTTENVIGLLRGSDPVLSKQVVVVGGHYDHLGFGDYGAAPSYRGQIHPGADDNASGTAGVIELATVFSQMDPPPKRSILFAAFSAEELGLKGSAHYVRNPVFPLKKTVAMLNLDMIGRSKEEYCEIGGVGTGKGLKAFLERMNQGLDLALDLKPRVSNDSDHANFAKKKIPALFFFTGYHEDYHRPSDTWEKINVEGTMQILKLILRATYQFADQERRFEFRKPRKKARG